MKYAFAFSTCLACLMCLALGCSSDAAKTKNAAGGGDDDGGGSAAHDTGVPSTACDSDSDCDDGKYCNGAETCDNSSCKAATAPCALGQCDEAADSCKACTGDAECDDGLGCNGTETCTNAKCASGTPLCTAPSACIEATDTCTMPTVVVSQAFAKVFGDGAATEDTFRGVALDADGNVYVTGGSHGGMAATAGAYDTTANGNMDIYVAKFDPQGNVVWATYLGGMGYDRAYGVELAPNGDVIVAGRGGPGMPTTAGAFQPAFGGDDCASVRYGKQDGYVARLSADGSKLLWASYLGRNDLYFVRDVAVDAQGDIYLATSEMVADDAVIVPAAMAGNGKCSVKPGPYTWTAGKVWSYLGYSGSGGVADQCDSMIVKVKGDGTAVEWIAYAGGSDVEGSTPSLTVDPKGDVHFFTYSKSTDLLLKGDQTQHDTLHDVYVLKLHSDGALVYARRLGGNGPDTGDTHNITADADGNTFVTFATRSDNLFTTPGAYDATFNGGCDTNCLDPNYYGDSYVAKISADGSTILAATYIGGSNGDGSEGIRVDAAGNVYVTASTVSPDFPTTSDAAQKTHGGAEDGVMYVLSPDLGMLRYATFYGDGVTQDLVANALRDGVWVAVGSSRPQPTGYDQRDAVIVRATVK